MLKARNLLFTAVLCSFTAAQNFEWVNTVPLDIQTNPAYLVSPLALDNSGLPVCARMVNFREIYNTTYYGDVAVEKRNPEGFQVWGDTIYGKVDVSDLILDGGDNVICTGSFRDTLEIGTMRLIYTGTGAGSFLLKLDSSGNPVWLKDGSEYISQYGSITALAENGLNNIYLGVSDYPLQSMIVTLDENGNIVSTIQQTNVALIGDISRDVSGNIWVTGFTSTGSQSFNGFDTTGSFSYSEYVVKYNSSGEAQWVTFIRDVTVQQFRIVTDNSGNAYLSGNLFDSTSFGNLHASGPQWVYDYFVTKIDPDGNFIWLNELPPGNTITGDATIGNGNFLACRGDGQTFVTGIYRGEVYFGNDVMLEPYGYYDVFVLSYSPDGEVLWAKPAGSGTYDQGNSIAADENGNCYLTGMVSENFVFDTISATGGLNNLYLAKLKYEEIVSAEDEFKTPGSVPDNFLLTQNYPNPFNPATNIRYSIPSSGFVSLKIYDALGKETASLVNEEKPAGNYEVNFDASELTSGVYFYQLRSGNFVQTRKMMLIK